MKIDPPKSMGRRFIKSISACTPPAEAPITIISRFTISSAFSHVCIAKFACKDEQKMTSPHNFYRFFDGVGGSRGTTIDAFIEIS